MFNKQTFKKHLINIRGSKQKEKYFVLESDDWGAIRIPNTNVRETLWQKGYTRKSDPFSRYDALETTQDYEMLFNTLLQFKDFKGNNPVVTANFIMNNPDFAAILQDDFQQYYAESFQKTYQNDALSRGAWQVLNQGMQHKMIVPQFHGAEHLNVIKWMQKLQNKDVKFLDAFHMQCYAIDAQDGQNKRDNLMAAYDHDSKEGLDYILKSIQKGLIQFENTFGFQSKTTIAPCYVWNEAIEQQMNVGNVKCFQGSYVQNIPNATQNFNKKYRYQGESNKNKQSYLVRNGLFEPSIHENVDWIKQTMESVEIAFYWGKPAVIATHRINFAGRLDESRRNNNIQLLGLLLKELLKKHPDVQFLDSASLYQKINQAQ